MSGVQQYDRAKLQPEVIDRLSRGEPLEQICRDEHMPSSRSVSYWRKDDSGFDAEFLAARDSGFDAIAERLRQTARGRGADMGGDSTGDVQRDKLIIETDLKLLAKWDPRRYGERIQHANDPTDPMPAPQFVIQPVSPARRGSED